ncbi:MAG: glycosyltransferase family 39 protein [Janthinobacterium lividum]
MPERRFPLNQDLFLRALILCVVVLISLPSLGSSAIDGLDSAHHILDGYFFRDLIVSHPFRGLPHFALAYYQQYPALGFVFWPPLTPAVFGLFDLVGGPHVLTTRVSMLFFGATFALALYSVLRRQFPALLSFCAVVAAVTVPGISRSFNEIMLELPTLAFMMLAIMSYQRFVEPSDGTGSSLRRTVLFSFASAAVIYSKQPAWFLYPALLFDFLLNHRPELRTKKVRIAVGLIALLCLPLVAYTVKFGHANLAQSVGNNTKLIMTNYQSLPRWSLAAWTFYPRLAPSLLNPLVMLLACGALATAFLKKDFLRANALWIGWFVFAYLTFSFYDNRVARHATFWWPAWIVLAAAFLYFLQRNVRAPQARFAALLLLLPVPFQARAAFQQTYGDFQGERPVIAGLFAGRDPGNILLFGSDKQVFIALIREYDGNRQVHAIRGEQLLSSGVPLATICHDYRIGTVLIEIPEGKPVLQDAGLSAVLDSSVFQPLQAPTFTRYGHPVRAATFRYTGSMSPTIAPVSLSNRLL